MRGTARQFRLAFASSLVVVLSGCGTFQLASGVVPYSSKTQEQQQLDNLACKDQARLEANTTERQTGAFLLGMTIVGAPVAFEMEKAKQREVFKTCMEAKGYRVLPPSDQASTPPRISNPPSTAQAASRAPEPQKPAAAAEAAAPTTATNASSQAASARDEAVQLQKVKELREKGLISEEEYEKKRKEILDRL